MVSKAESEAYASVVRPVVNNFVQKKSYFYKL